MSYFISGRWLKTWGVFSALSLLVALAFSALDLPDDASVIGIAGIFAGTIWYDVRDRRRWRAELKLERSKELWALLPLREKVSAKPTDEGSKIV